MGATAVKPLKPQPGLTEQVYQRLLDEMSEGRLAPGQHLVQEQVAAQLGVSRQPVQQALALLKNDGLLLELGKRGLFVAPLEAEGVRHRYEIRAALDGLAARLAAQRAKTEPALARAFEREGEALLVAGRSAVSKAAIAAMVQCDIAFHEFVYEASGNPMLSQTAAPHWRHMRRVMGEVLRSAGPPQVIWRQHRSILDAIVAGDARAAEKAAVAHVWTAAERLDKVLSPGGDQSAARRKSTADNTA
jgi:DNA-binding GntR family transcriptional regulator